jgi:hypothetical protein
MAFPSSSVSGCSVNLAGDLIPDDGDEVATSLLGLLETARYGSRPLV